MIIQCNSCNKKFTVPDSAITANGRLVQCSSCGNQWTQYPVDQSLKKVNKTPKQQKRKKQKTIDTYSDEYLQKKHGIKIIDPSSVSETLNKTKSKSKKLKKNKHWFWILWLFNSIFCFIAYCIWYLKFN